MNKATWPNYSGLVYYVKNRVTGTHVGVYNGAEAGLDTDGGRMPWSTVCEEHGEIVHHRSRFLAEAHAAHVNDWCSVCQSGGTK